MDTELVCKNLQSQERSDRQTALKNLIKFFEEEKSEETLSLVYNECYLYLLKCYSDRFENCRELACNVVTEFMRNLPKNDYYLQYIVTTIASRIGQKELQEHSEEMRLIYLTQLHFLIDKFRSDEFSGDPILKSYDEIIDILLKTLKDPYPAVQREACNCIKTLATATPSFHYRAETLAKPLYSMLRHKHSVNRIAAVEALGIICLHIRTNNECIKRIIMEISPLLMDSMPLVRKECGKTGCLWLLELKDRYSFFERILPLVLCSLNDDSPEIREQIEKLWVKCGEQYFEENATELNTIEMIDTKPENYPENVKRPTLGCRALAQRGLRIVKSIMLEVTEWKEEIRLHSLKLLWQVVLHGEVKLTPMFMDILPDLSRACADSDSRVARMATKVAELMGKLLNYNEWFDNALEYLREHPRPSCLECFYFLYLGSNESNQNDILKVARLLTQKEFSNSLNPEIQSVLLKLVNVLLNRHQNPKNEKSLEDAMEKMNFEDDEAEKCLYHVIIKVMALSFDKLDNPLQEEGRILLRKLSKDNEESIPELHAIYLNSLIETFDCLDAELDEFSEPILLLHGTIRICGFQKVYLPLLKKCILVAWENVSADADLEESVTILQEFVKEVVEPHLIWKPGASAESLRSFAAATLCSITQGAPQEAPRILPQYASHFVNLIEDKPVATRVYTLRCFMNCGAIDYENLRKIGYAVVLCLDDESSEARKWAARVLCKFDTSAMSNDELNGWHGVVEHILDILFSHLENPEHDLCRIIKNTIIELGKQYRDLYDKAFKNAGDMYPVMEDLFEIDTCVKSTDNN